MDRPNRDLERDAVSDAHKTTKPHDRLTRLCDTMSRALEADPEYGEDDIQCVIMLDSRKDKRGGLVTVGYDDDKDALVAMFGHLSAIFEANGSKLEIIPIPHRGQG
jgi:hypothetical protein